MVAVATNSSLHHCLTALRVLQQPFVPMTSSSGHKCCLKVCKRAQQSSMQHPTRIRTRNARRHTTAPAPMMFYLVSFPTLIIIFTLVCFPVHCQPRVRVAVAVAGAMWQHHHGPQPQQPNTTLPLALLHASPRPRDYLICRSFGRTFSRIVLPLIHPSSTQVLKI